MHGLVACINKSAEKLTLCGKKRIKDCPTRWNSTFIMIQCLLHVKNALSSIGIILLQVSASEWKILEGIKTLLQPFAQFTTLISGEEYTTLSSVLPAIVDMSIHVM